MYKYTIEVVYGEIDGRALRYSSEITSPEPLDPVAVIYKAEPTDKALKDLLRDTTNPLITISIMRHRIKGSWRSRFKKGLTKCLPVSI